MIYKPYITFVMSAVTTKNFITYVNSLIKESVGETSRLEATMKLNSEELIIKSLEDAKDNDFIKEFTSTIESFRKVFDELEVLKKEEVSLPICDKGLRRLKAKCVLDIIDEVMTQEEADKLIKEKEDEYSGLVKVREENITIREKKISELEHLIEELKKKLKILCSTFEALSNIQKECNNESGLYYCFKTAKEERKDLHDRISKVCFTKEGYVSKNFPHYNWDMNFRKYFTNMNKKRINELEERNKRYQKEIAELKKKTYERDSYNSTEDKKLLTIYIYENELNVLKGLSSDTTKIDMQRELIRKRNETNTKEYEKMKETKYEDSIRKITLELWVYDNRVEIDLLKSGYIVEEANDVLEKGFSYLNSKRIEDSTYGILICESKEFFYSRTAIDIQGNKFKVGIKEGLETISNIGEFLYVLSLSGYHVNCNPYKYYGSVKYKRTDSWGRDDGEEWGTGICIKYP